MALHSGHLVALCPARLVVLYSGRLVALCSARLVALCSARLVAPSIRAVDFTRPVRCKSVQWSEKVLAVAVDLIDSGHELLAVTQLGHSDWWFRLVPV